MTSIPLDPRVGGRCILTSALQEADLIVSTTAARESWVIRKATRSVVSHSLLYVGNDEIIEAAVDGVVRRSIHAALAEATLAVAYRHARITPATAASVVQFAKDQVGREYDLSGAVRGGAYESPILCLAFGIVQCAAMRSSRMNSQDRFYCSELVMAAFSHARIPLAKTPPDRGTPETIAQARLDGTLRYVGHLKVVGG